jgi:A/G-specific adenine glycosylase
MHFSNSLIDWYLQNKRDLPWRNTTNPYAIWLSEIMLQQTRVTQGLPYFYAFMDAFPTVFDLANAQEEEVLKLWQGLGYYSRARNLHATAKQIAFDCNGKFPDKYEKLLQLKGVGAYTAAAIASFSYNEPVAVVDGNVFRVLARYFGMNENTTLLSTKKIFQNKAQELLPKNKAALFNQAIMEFGALKCVPKSPDCSNCVLASSCFAFQNNKVNELPVKSKKIKVKNRYFNYLIIKDVRGFLVVEKRIHDGIWKNLYEFQLVETQENIAIQSLVAKIKDDFNPKHMILKNETPLVHKLTHQHLHIRFFELEFSHEIEAAKPLDTIMKLPFPIVIHKFLESNYL